MADNLFSFGESKTEFLKTQLQAGIECATRAYGIQTRASANWKKTAFINFHFHVENTL